MLVRANFRDAGLRDLMDDTCPNRSKYLTPIKRKVTAVYKEDFKATLTHV